MNCQQATRKVSDAMDRPLGLAERLSLHAHLLICGHCRQFSRQLALLRKAARREAAGKPPSAP